ncbi:hypothetical protein NLJ89_g10438 [Agrocybe chaxingu]|uniref:F-box domain-containing protein n=1 Tax=Agrocybe chaxingu TaxID=84603 RepID=A0A9W8JY61_9AGAR|nr:hypothetical protein NLJ89_g10438 [Agrocybe chaxingu]
MGGSMIGNYVAGYISKNLRTDARVLGYYKSHDLNQMLDLPTDLVFEIFSHLHPIDLYNLIRTTKSLRGLLLNRHSRRVWKMSFKANVGIPDCPSDVSFPKWVSLLFGPDDCDTCGANYAMPDFAFRARFCESCMMRNYMSKGFCRSTLGEHPNYKLADIWKLLRYSRQWSGYRYSKAGCQIPQYLVTHVIAREKEIKLYLNKIDAGIPDALHEFEQYKESVAKEIEEDMQFVRFCETWCLSIHDAVIRTRGEITDQLADRCFSRLVKEGRDHRDIGLSALQVAVHSGHITRLRGLRYRLMMTNVDRWIRQAHQDRLIAERKKLVESRQAIVDNFYHEFVVQNFKPTHWKSVPDDQKIRDIKLFKKFINDEAPDAAQPPKEMALSEIRQFVEEAIGSRKKSLAFNLLCALKKFPAKGFPDTYSVIELATSVFACTACLSERNIYTKPDVEVRVGWEDVGRKDLCGTCLDWSPRRRNSDMRFSADGARAVVSLLNLLSLDPNATTATELDGLDPRFVCEVCPPRVIDGKKTRLVYKWRECVGHILADKFKSQENVIRRSPRPTLLTEECAKSVRLHEQWLNNSLDSTNCWACTHCAAHFSSNLTREGAKCHVQVTHGIRRPEVHVDYHSQLTTTRPPTIEDDQINVETKPKTEKPKAIEERKKIFENLYTYHCYVMAHIKPTQWMCLAGAEEILDLELFENFIQDQSADVMLHDEDEALAGIRRFVESSMKTCAP